MITPQDFPYISSIYVNDCYAYQNFNIELEKHLPFSHLILTGKNGSGKSTILKYIDILFRSDLNGEGIGGSQNALKKSILKDLDAPIVKAWELRATALSMLKINYLENHRAIYTYKELKQQFIYSYAPPYRNSKSIKKVEVPTKQEEFKKQIETNHPESSDYFIKNFKQYLVNKKVNQAFAQLKNKKEDIEATNIFFKKVEAVFAEVIEDKYLILDFDEDNYEFYLQLSDDRKLTFDILPDGFLAFFSILMDLFVRVDLIRKNVQNNTYDPCGIVLIDEPETHLHLSLQYQVLPILTSLFPNVQFIVATHSAAVISSIKNVTVFDLTTKESLSDEVTGKSFSELMVSHFGLENEFSPVADKIFDEVNEILRKYRKDLPARKSALERIIKENGRYISPTMRFELEAKLAETE